MYSSLIPLTFGDLGAMIYYDTITMGRKGIMFACGGKVLHVVEFLMNFSA